MPLLPESCPAGGARAVPQAPFLRSSYTASGTVSLRRSVRFSCSCNLNMTWFSQLQAAHWQTLLLPRGAAAAGGRGCRCLGPGQSHWHLLTLKFSLRLAGQPETGWACQNLGMTPLQSEPRALAGAMAVRVSSSLALAVHPGHCRQCHGTRASNTDTCPGPGHHDHGVPPRTRRRPSPGRGRRPQM